SVNGPAAIYNQGALLTSGYRSRRIVTTLHRGEIGGTSGGYVAPSSLGQSSNPQGRETRDEGTYERIRSAARSRNSTAAPLCAGADPGRGTRRRSRPELPDPCHRQTAFMAARHRSARLVVHDPAQSARERGTAFGAGGKQGPTHRSTTINGSVECYSVIGVA